MDSRDRQILEKLQTNSRIPFSSLARKLGVPTATVRYRVERMQKLGIIKGFFTLFSVESFGFSAYHLLLRLSCETSVHTYAREICHPAVRAINIVNGAYDIHISLIGRDNIEAQHIAEKLSSSEHVESSTILALTQTSADQLPEPDFTLDQHHLRLLKILSTDARCPIQGLAKELELSYDQTLYRLRQLKKIVRFVLWMDTPFALLLAQAEQVKLSNIAEITWAAKSIGTWNYMAYIRDEHPHKIIRTLRSELKFHEYTLLLHEKTVQFSYWADALSTTTFKR